MGTPRRTVPSLSKREGDLRGVLAAGMGGDGTRLARKTAARRVWGRGRAEKSTREDGSRQAKQSRHVLQPAGVLGPWEPFEPFSLSTVQPASRAGRWLAPFS